MLGYDVDIPFQAPHPQALCQVLSYPCLSLCNVQGRQKQQKRTSTFLEFCQASSGTLIGTDVAARGLDIPEVDWIVQYDPPDDPKVSRSLYASKASPPPSRLNPGLSVDISKSSFSSQGEKYTLNYHYSVTKTKTFF